MRKYINILEDSSESNLSQLWATYAVNSCILGNLGKAGATGEEDGPDYRSENERLLGMVSSSAGPEIADKLKKWSDYLCKRVHLKRGPSFEALFKALAQWGVDANHVYDQLDAVIDLQGATRTWGGQANKAPGRPSAYGVQEGSEFGAKYNEKLAQKVFDLNPSFSTSGTADELVSAGYAAIKADLGPRARGTFRSDDFVSDFVSSYSYLQNQGKGSRNY